MVLHVLNGHRAISKTTSAPVYLIDGQPLKLKENAGTEGGAGRPLVNAIKNVKRLVDAVSAFQALLFFAIAKDQTLRYR
jgi:hypothetical protein